MKVYSGVSLPYYYYEKTYLFKNKQLRICKNFIKKVLKKTPHLIKMDVYDSPEPFVQTFAIIVEQRGNSVYYSTSLTNNHVTGLLYGRTDEAVADYLNECNDEYVKGKLRKILHIHLEETDINTK